MPQIRRVEEALVAASHAQCPLDIESYDGIPKFDSKVKSRSISFDESCDGRMMFLECEKDPSVIISNIMDVFFHDFFCPNFFVYSARMRLKRPLMRKRVVDAVKRLLCRSVKPRRMPVWQRDVKCQREGCQTPLLPAWQLRICS